MEGTATAGTERRSGGNGGDGATERREWRGRNDGDGADGRAGMMITSGAAETPPLFRELRQWGWGQRWLTTKIVCYPGGFRLNALPQKLNTHRRQLPCVRPCTANSTVHSRHMEFEYQIVRIREYEYRTVLSKKVQVPRVYLTLYTSSYLFS